MQATDRLASGPSGRGRQVALFGATGTAGRATALALHGAGHAVTALGRRDPEIAGIGFIQTDPADRRAVHAALTSCGTEDIVSCLASRTGAPADAWAIDHAAHLTILDATADTDVSRFVLLSAICVQKPRLAFQHAKLAFEAALVASGLTYSIVRPTAFFKSLSGQVERVRQGKSYLMFGDGTLTACKPLSDRDLGDYMAGCLTDPARQDRILPIGGPGPALTPRMMGDEMFRLTGMPPRFRQVPPALLGAIRRGLGIGGWISPRLAAKAELARIGQYYATESMLLWDADQKRYDVDATPETGRDRLFDHYARLISGERTHQRGDHAVF